MLFYFENEQEQAVTVNGNRYRAMLNECVFTKFEEEDINNIWFQQNGATSHTTEATLDVLRPVFEDRDLIPSDYYLRGVVKDKCYADKPETIDSLKDNIYIRDVLHLVFENRIISRRADVV